MLTETQIRQIRETAEQDGDLRIAAINPDDFWVQYPDPRTIRLLISKPGSGTYSGFVEARVGPNQVTDLVRQLRYAGLTVDPDDIESAIEMA